jgi:hypothetical protein
MAEPTVKIPYLDLITGGVGQILTALPVFLAAYKILHGIWAAKQNPNAYQIWLAAHPGGTLEQFQHEQFTQFNTYLLTESQAVVDFTAQWLESHGYVKQPDGSWLPPTA